MHAKRLLWRVAARLRIRSVGFSKHDDEVSGRMVPDTPALRRKVSEKTPSFRAQSSSLTVQRPLFIPISRDKSLREQSFSSKEAEHLFRRAGAPFLPSRRHNF